jgi:hypothetical protein
VIEQPPPPWQLRPIAYRVSPLPPPRRPAARRAAGAWPDLALIIETVAGEGLAGAARFGCYLLCRGEQILARGFFTGPAVRPGDERLLERLSRRNRLEALLSLDGFLKLVYRYAYKKRLPLVGFGLLAQLSQLAADWAAPEVGTLYEGGISLILWTKPAPPGRLRRGQRRLRNGELENGYRPRVVGKVLADESVALAFTGRGEPDPVDRIPEGASEAQRGYVFPGRLLPLERLAYGLSGQRQRSLEAACASFAIDCPPQPAQAGGDVAEQARCCLARTEATHHLYRALLKRHRTFRLGLPADRVFSPASFAKAAFAAIGISPPLERFQGDLAGLGAAACAAYGGWSGVGIRNVPGGPPTPVRLLDVTGEYAVAAHQIRIWQLLCAERLSLVPMPPEEIEAWIADQRPGMVRLTPELNVFCRLRPRDDVLPHRIKPRRTWLTTIAPLTCEESLWWPLADVVESFFETGRIPRLDACLRLVGEGRLADLQPVEFPGLGRFDPNQPDADLFLFLARGRLRLAETDGDPAEQKRLAALYKQWDNSACSGVFLEVHTREPSRRKHSGTVIGPDGPYQTKAHVFEEPGRWFFPPFYALVTAAGRLLLHDAINETEQRGGRVAYWDTDSIAALASPDGRLIPCPGGRHRGELGHEFESSLSYSQVDELRRSLERHSPYQPNQEPTVHRHAEPRSVAPGSPILFRLEPENFVAADQRTYLYAVASKRKTPYLRSQDGVLLAVSPSEFALGHLIDPSGRGNNAWIAEGWQWAALNGREPSWLDQPALAHLQLTRHSDLTRLGGKQKHGPRPWDTLVVGQTERPHHRNPDGALRQPVALYHPGLTIENAHWRDYTTGAHLDNVQLAPRHPHERVPGRQHPTPLRTMRSLLTAHVRAPELKALGPNRTPCTARTAGTLRPMPTTAYVTVPIGRETNYPQETGVLREPDYATYPDPNKQPTQEQVRMILRGRALLPGERTRLAQELAISESTLRRYLRTGKTRPRTRERAETLAAAIAQQVIANDFPGAPLPDQPEALLYLATHTRLLDSPRQCHGCGNTLSGRRRRWCASCKNNGWRRQQQTQPGRARTGNPLP